MKRRVARGRILRFSKPSPQPRKGDPGRDLCRRSQNSCISPSFGRDRSCACFFSGWRLAITAPRSCSAVMVLRERTQPDINHPTFFHRFLRPLSQSRKWDPGRDLAITSVPLHICLDSSLCSFRESDLPFRSLGLMDRTGQNKTETIANTTTTDTSASVQVITETKPNAMNKKQG